MAIMQSGRIGAFFLVFSSTLVAAQTKTAKEIEIPQFEDHSLTSGLTVSHISTPEQHYIVESMSGGIALFDCDDDGKLDIAVVNGRPWIVIAPAGTLWWSISRKGFWRFGRIPAKS